MLVLRFDSLRRRTTVPPHSTDAGLQVEAESELPAVETRIIIIILTFASIIFR